MLDPVRELKTKAEILHGRIASRHLDTVRRLRALAAYAASPDERLMALAPGIRRRECLALLAVELGFSGWPHARHVMTGDPNVADFGTMLYPDRCGGNLNLWYRRYEEAAAGRRESGGYLLAYRRQFMVVHRPFIDALGLGPADESWQRLGFDWVRPIDMSARSHLYGMLVAQLPPEGRHC